MNNKMVFAAALAASLLLTACDSKTGGNSQGNNQTGDGIIYQYTDFLDYTFDGNYKIGEASSAVAKPDTEYEQTVTTWDVTFTTKNGKEMTYPFYTTNYTSLEEQYYGNEELHNLSEFDSFVTSVMGNIATTEFVEEVASKHLDLQYDNVRGVYICPEIGDMTILAYPPIFIGGSEGNAIDKEIEIVKERVKLGSGYSIADTDLKSVCSNPDFTFTCQFVINNNLDKEKYIGIMEDIMKDFSEYVGTPMNYNFFLAESENQNWLMRKMHLMGEEVPSDKIDSGEINYSDELKKAILERH